MKARARAAYTFEPMPKNKNKLYGHPLYRFEEVTKDGSLKIGIGDLVFETYQIVARYGWLARTARSQNWPENTRKLGVLAGSAGLYARKGNAERSMRRFLEMLLLNGERRAAK